MKTKFLLLCVGAILLFTLNAQAALFSEDFQGTLAPKWTGKGGGGFSGQIVMDPLDMSNSVLNFASLNSAGDIFTKTTFSPGAYSISFDYLGKSVQGSVAGNLGGYVGLSQGLPGTHTWLWATSTVSGANDALKDDAGWNSYTFPFTIVGVDRHLMLEDFLGSGGVAGDAYFDNITITPAPPAILLLGTGLLGLAGFARKKFKR